MDKELDGLAEPVREAVCYFDDLYAEFSDEAEWQKIRAELIRLARENAELRHLCDLAQARAERAESELAALRKRVAESPSGMVCGNVSKFSVQVCPNIPDRAHLRVLMGKSVRLVEEPA